MREDDKKHRQEIEDRIREVAYLMWESAGRLSDMAHEYWVAAEKEVLATWRKVTEQVVPSEKPEKAKEPEAEASKPAPSEAPKPAKAATKPAARAPKLETEVKAEETERPKTVTKKPASRKTAKPESTAVKPKAQTTRAKP